MKLHTSRVCCTAALALGLAFGVACVKTANDNQVASDIQSKISADSGLQGKVLSVQSEKGTVTLSGTVDNDTQREAAAKYAASEPGVKTVINNLQVASEQASADNAPAATSAMESGSRAPAEAPARRARSSKPSPSRKPSHQTAQPENQMAQAAPAAPPAPPVQSQDPVPTQPAAAAPPPPEVKKVTVPSGAVIPVRLVDAIDSATAQAGDTFHATLDAPVAVDGDVVIPAHYDVEGHVVTAQASGKFAGRALLELQLDRIN